MNNQNQISPFQLYSLVIVRVLLGWYFLYEGVIKLLNPTWSAIGFLKSSEGIFKKFFSSLAANSSVLELVNFLNIWGLIAIGIGLITGAFSRLAAISGAVLVFMYYLAHPPTIEAQPVLIGSEQALWVDKNLIFAFVLIVLYVIPTSQIIGLDRLIFKKK